MDAGKQLCEQCGGSGWRVVESADGSHALRCSCHPMRSAGLGLRRAGLPRRYETCSLESPQIDRPQQQGVFEPINPSQERALKIARRFVADFPIVEAGLLFIGPCGVGKTHLAAGIVRELVLAKNVRARFVDFRELLKEIQASYNPLTETSEKQVLAQVLESELLVIDDLGAEKPSAWVRDTIAYILNDRYKRNRPVVITTTLRDDSMEGPGRRPIDKLKERAGLREVERFDSLVDRIGVASRSRLHEMCKIVAMQGEDFRAIKSHAVESPPFAT